MKKLSLGKLKLASEEVLQRNQMAGIYGGMGCSFTCYCGFVGGCWEESTFTVNADNISEALWAAGMACQGQGATCSGN